MGGLAAITSSGRGRVVTSSALRSDNLFMHFSAALVMLIARLFIQEDAMSTSSEVVKSLEQALTATRTALQQTDDLIVAHDYQDVASLVTNAAAALLAIRHLPDVLSKDEDAFRGAWSGTLPGHAVYDIIDSEIEEGIRPTEKPKMSACCSPLMLRLRRGHGWE